ncbi:MAG: hypothetical protein JEZ00_12610 [Anaerolineaceae bacterium]|nr:hypothetical protein [Anaerolineaceae bacterium]
MSTQGNIPEVTPASMSDLEDIAAFNGRIHDEGNNAERIIATVRDLIHLNKIKKIERGFVLARHPENNAVITSSCLIPQNLRYGNIPIQAGNPEFVGTDTAFRQKGLISRQFEILHQWSAENGDDIQIIGGIPYFYRKYGYEMTVSMEPRRTDSLLVLDKLADPEKPLQFDAAVERDIPDLIRLFGQEHQSYLLTGDWSKQDWQYILQDSKNNGCAAKRIFMVRRKNGTLIGAIKFHNHIEDGRFYIVGAEIDPVQTTWDEVQPALLMKLKELAQAQAELEGKLVKQVGLQMPLSHPLSIRLAYLFKQESEGYAWYIRIPDLQKFLQKISPVIEENVHNSPYRGLSRTLKLNLYTNSLSLEFGKGKLKSIKAWKPGSYDGGDFLCPELAFLHLLMGHRSTAEIQKMYRDCYGNKDGAAVVDACFPKRESNLSLVI